MRGGWFFFVFLFYTTTHRVSHAPPRRRFPSNNYENARKINYIDNDDTRIVWRVDDEALLKTAPRHSLANGIRGTFIYVIFLIYTSWCTRIIQPHIFIIRSSTNIFTPMPLPLHPGKARFGQVQYYYIRIPDPRLEDKAPCGIRLSGIQKTGEIFPQRDSDRIWRIPSVGSDDDEVTTDYKRGAEYLVVLIYKRPG